MILDNKNKKAIKWIKDYTKPGTMDIVTGYFTIGALVWLYETTKEHITQYRMILGDIVSTGFVKDNPLDLLNEALTINEALEKRKNATAAVDFLKKNIVSLKTLEPNFCHAKLYLNRASPASDIEGYFISGSSNLTEAGLGMRLLHNVELNIGGQPSAPDYDKLTYWFDELWDCEEAHLQKTIIDENGKKSKIDFKQYLINEIQKIYKEYSPADIYYKILFELLGDSVISEMDNPEFIRQIGKLENTEIYKACYPFQQQGVRGLIRMLENYRGAILADAVGLGKTWTALAVIKYYMLRREGFEIIVICPKKLEHNWRMYLEDHHSCFENDKIRFKLRFHTSLTENLICSYTDTKDYKFSKEKQRLFVIDESHNLRNDKSSRYIFLVNEILAHNENARVLLLSATPINNTLNDVRNQFKLLVKGDNSGFENTLDVKNIDSTFKTATNDFKVWAASSKPHISALVAKLHPNFLKLTDALILSRNRKMIMGMQPGLYFPKKEKPKNLYVTPKFIGNYESFDELFNDFPPHLSGYQPAAYLKQAKKVKVTEDEKQRQFYLAKMMYILMVKRLESSWYAFQKTIIKISDHHQHALNKILKYETDKRDAEIVFNPQQKMFADDEDDEIAEEWENLTLGKSNPISLKDIDAAGKLSAYKKDLKSDIASFAKLKNNLTLFSDNIENEQYADKNHSLDTKLQELMKLINDKQKSGKNNDNQKIIIFTVYADTATYLYEQLKARNFERVAMVSGSTAYSDEGETGAKGIERILERFSPYTKLFREKKWDGWHAPADITDRGELYADWKTWLHDTHADQYFKIENPVEILIATDILSEGQNLQDCDMVVNYDIHWNPVRIIQRLGRIDRLGSPNDSITGVNFWPSDNIETYLKLQSRIEMRMAAMKLAGSEVDPEITERFKRMTEDESLEKKQEARMLEHMKTSWDDIDQNDEGLGFDNLSLEIFRQQLAAELDKNNDKYREMPHGIYSGFILPASAASSPGIIALLAHTKAGNEKRYDLIYIDEKGESLAFNQKEVLDLLSTHHEQPRAGLQELDKADSAELNKWAAALKSWINKQASTITEDAAGAVSETAGNADIALIKSLQVGSKNAVAEIHAGRIGDKTYSEENIQLITWLLVSPTIGS